MTALTTLRLTDGAQRIGDCLLADGAVIVTGLLDSDTLNRFKTEVDPLLVKADPQLQHLNPVLDLFYGQQVRHVTGMAGKSTTFAHDIMCHPLYLSLCDRILGPSCADYVLNLGHLMDRGPGAKAQIMHRDQDVWIHMPRPHPELEIASILALVDFSEANGATFVIPGSHRWDYSRQGKEEEKRFAKMPAGSAVIYLGSTLHGGGTNATSHWRGGVHISYTLGWLRTEENHSLAVPPQIAEQLPARAQQLLGYSVHDAIDDMGGYLGMVDMQNPQHLLNQGKLR